MGRYYIEAVLWGCVAVTLFVDVVMVARFV